MFRRSNAATVRVWHTLSCCTCTEGSSTALTCVHLTDQNYLAGQHKLSSESPFGTTEGKQSYPRTR